MTDANGCTATAAKSLTISANPTATITGQSSICEGATAEFTALGGVSFAWSNGATTAAITVSNAGVYRVTVTDANGCISTGERTLTINNLPTAAISGAEEICEGSSTDFTATGGVSYVWNTGATTANLNISNAGLYRVTVTDANGCTATASKSLTISANPTATITGQSSICEGATAEFTALGGVSYAWSNGASTAAITVSNAGVYRVTVTDANGCISTGERTLTINNRPTAAISGADEICEGSSTDFTATGGVSYVWNTGANTNILNINTSGNYTVTVTDANGCTATAAKSLTISANPTATITGQSSICEGAATEFTALGGVSYAWSNGASTAAITVSNAGVYRVTVTDANGCISTGERTLTINNRPAAAISGADEICEGSSTDFTATGGVSYVWNTGATTANLNISNAGLYSVTVTDANGCTATAAKSLTISTNPTATITGQNSICEGAATEFTALGGLSYAWSNGATTATITVSNAGVYRVTVTDANGCISTGERTLTINNRPAAAISGADEICEGSSTDFTATGGVSYVWNTGATTANLNISNAGLYSVTVTDANGCTATAAKSLTISTNPTATITGQSSICEGAATEFTALGGVSYAWSNGASTAAITVSNAGVYRGRVTDANGCVSTGERTLTINNLPAAAISGADEICEGSSTDFTATGGVSYVWNTGATTANLGISAMPDYTA
ncbi:MAG: hypothetical protein IPM26_16950 [Saprospiraceae bacterium]|nr:hypothetical protein [Saprospiraceae bacterium]